MRTPSAVLAIAALFVVAMADVVHAQPSGADSAVAEALFREADALFAAGRVSEACAKLQESQRLDPKPGTLLNLATCHEKEGKTASAWTEYSELAAIAERAGQRDRQALAAARTRELEQRLSRVRLKTSALAGDAIIELDGKRLTTAAIGPALPVDPGVHVISASAPGKASWSQRTAVPAGPIEVTVTIPTLGDASVTSLAAPPAPGAATESPEPVAQTGSGVRAAGWIVVAAGAATLGVAGAFGVVALSKKGDAVDAGCAGARCPTIDAGATRDEARTAGTISTVLFVTGGVVAAAGVVVLLAAPAVPRGGRHSRREAVSVAASPSSVRLRVVW